MCQQIRNPNHPPAYTPMHGETRDERIRFRVRSSVLARAEKWAERRGESLSAYVRSALNEKMDEDLMSEIQSKTPATDGH